MILFDNILSSIKSKTWSSFSDAKYPNGLNVINATLQFHNGKQWIYGYKLIIKNNTFPIYVISPNKGAYIANTDNDLKNIGKAILDRTDDDLFKSKQIKYVLREPMSEIEIGNMIKYNDNILDGESLTYTEKTVFTYIV